MNNRDFKFRAWNQFEKEFYTKPFLISHTGLSFIYNEEFLHIEDFDAVNPAMGLIIQQYTGLKDSNGKEIYEGDIVKDTWKENHPYGYSPNEWNDEESIFVVKYEPPQFVFPKHSGEQTCIEELNRIVIGNIFENPELLK